MENVDKFLFSMFSTWLCVSVSLWQTLVFQQPAKSTEGLNTQMRGEAAGKMMDWNYRK
jgi:hypothetical protein